jgi:hypothetical protein
MPIDKAKWQKFDEALDQWLEQRAQYPDEDEDTDPVQFMEPPEKPPIGEPPTTPQKDGAPQEDAFTYKRRSLF